MTHTPAHTAAAHGAASETFCAHRGQHGLAPDGTAKLSKQGLHRIHFSPAYWERQWSFRTTYKLTSVGRTTMKANTKGYRFSLAMSLAPSHFAGELILFISCRYLRNNLWALAKAEARSQAGFQ